MRRAAMTAMAIALAATGAQAAGQTGAPVGQAMQPGGWGRGGWQSGEGAAPAPAQASAPIPATASPQPATAYPPAPTLAAAPAYAAPTPAAYVPQPPRQDYRPIRPGKRVPSAYADPIYTIVDWPAYQLGQPGPGMRWVRYYDDAILVDRRGRAIDVRQGIDWHAHRYAMPARSPSAPATAGYVPPVASTSTVRTGPDTVVTTQVIPPPRGNYGYGYGPDYGWGPGVTVTPSIVTTTTTTRYVTVPGASRSRRSARR